MYRKMEEKPEGKRPLGRPTRRQEVKWILEKQNGVVCTGFIWLRIGTSGWLL
jgi:hypothetical protein